MFCIPGKPILFGVNHFVIHVDAYREGEPCGSIYCKQINQIAPFSGVMPLLAMIDKILDDESPIQKYEDRRILRKAMSSKGGWKNANSSGDGKLATFCLRIYSRRNATLQGKLIWVEGKTDVFFRSALEMLLAMHRAIDTRQVQYMNAALG